MWQMKFPPQLARLTFKSLYGLISACSSWHFCHYTPPRVLLACFPLNTSFHFWSPHSCAWCSVSLKYHLLLVCLGTLLLFFQAQFRANLFCGAPQTDPLSLIPRIQSDVFPLNAILIVQFAKSFSCLSFKVCITPTFPVRMQIPKNQVPNLIQFWNLWAFAKKIAYMSLGITRRKR